MTNTVSNEVKRFNIFTPESVLKQQTIFSEQFKTKLDTEKSSYTKELFEEKVGEQHPFDYNVVEGICKKFGLVSAFINKITDYTVGPGIFIDSDDDKTVDVLEKWMKDTAFRIHLRSWFKEGLRKGSSYLEVAGLSDPNTEQDIKTVNSDTMYKKRDDYGNVVSFNQYLGKSTNSLSDEEIISLNTTEIIPLDINVVGNAPYGIGIVYPALMTLNNFLSAQKGMHKIMERKANNPIHVQMGNSEKDIIPTQQDVDGFGQKLQYMNECTEWVTDDTVKMSVLDFGKIGEKFADILENDYKLLSYMFEVPEVIMGAPTAGLNASGHANVQMDAFERSNKAYQEQLANIISKKIFDIVLVNNGIINAEYTIVWGQQSQEDKNLVLETYTKLLSVPTLSPGMRREIEKKIALLDDIDFDEVEAENEVAKKEEEDMMKQQQQLAVQKPNMVKPKESINEKYKSFYSFSNPIHEEVSPDTKISQWLDVDLEKYKENIIRAIREDDFSHLTGNTGNRLERGYMTPADINVLRNIFIKAIEENETIADVSAEILAFAKLKDLQREDVQIPKNKRAEVIAQTELSRLMNKGIITKIKTEARDNTILLRWNATIDAKVCPLCEGLDNQIFDGYSMTQSELPPAHPNCRCSLEEVTGIKRGESIRGIIEDGVIEGLAPQEIVAKIVKLYKTDESKLYKMIDSYLELVKHG